MTNIMATMVNPGMLPPLQVKDSRWLTLEVCREFTRNKCTRSETECKFAHPPPHVEVQNGRVTCCYDSIKGKCQRKDPPCKYLHPPQHLREQLLQNGRNNLILKNLQMQAVAAGLQPMVPNIIPPTMYEAGSGKALSYQHAALHPAGQYPVVGNPYLTMPSGAIFNPYLGQTVPQISSVVPNMDANAAQVQGMMQAQTGSQQKMQRADRLEPTTTTGSSASDSFMTGSYIDSIATTSQYSPVYFQGMAMPGMVPMIKRPAVADNKSGIPMYQPGGSPAYQQAALAAMQLQQPFAPVTIAGHPPSVPRF